MFTKRQRNSPSLACVYNHSGNCWPPCNLHDGLPSPDHATLGINSGVSTRLRSRVGVSVDRGGVDERVFDGCRVSYTNVLKHIWSSPKGDWAKCRRPVANTLCYKKLRLHSNCTKSNRISLCKTMSPFQIYCLVLHLSEILCQVSPSATTAYIPAALACNNIFRSVTYCPTIPRGNFQTVYSFDERCRVWVMLVCVVVANRTIKWPSKIPHYSLHIAWRARWHDCKFDTIIRQNGGNFLIRNRPLTWSSKALNVLRVDECLVQVKNDKFSSFQLTQCHLNWVCTVIFLFVLMQ